MDKDPDAYRTISEVAEALDIPPHVLRFWETKFPQVRPLKRGGGRRFYRRIDVDLLRTIRRLLYEDGYTIRGVQRLFKSKGTADAASVRSDMPAEPGSEAPADLDANARHLDFETASERDVLAWLSGEVTACLTILTDAAGAGSADERDRSRPILPPPAAGSDPAAPASEAPPP